MIPVRFSTFCLLALALVVGLSVHPRATVAQDPAKKDEALEKLLEKLDEPKAKPDEPTLPKPKPKAKPDGGSDPSKKDDALEKLLDKLDESKKPPEAAPKDGTKPSGEIAPKDQSLDKLLEGLGGLDDKPSPDDKKKSGGQGPSDEPPPPPKPGGDGGDAKANPLDDASKKLDEILEEKTGRKPKKKKQDGQGPGQGQGQSEEDGGPMGDLVKQMRDVEDRLGKPDTGQETRRKQIEIVKNLDTLLEQLKNSSGQGQAMRIMRGGQKPGGPPKPGQGNQQGATGDGVGMSKPVTPKTPPAPVELAKEVWGQLPTQFRDDMANVLKENPLPSKAELIKLYYLSLGKKSTNGD